MVIRGPGTRRWLGTVAPVAAMVIALCSVAVACSDDTSSTGDGGDPATAEKPNSGADESTDSIADDSAGTGTGLADQYDQRYCEVLTLTGNAGGARAEVWGSQGLNDCPQEAFDTLDAVAIATELGASVAAFNGPRYWTLDRIVANELEGSLEIRDFGGIVMRSIATVNLSAGTTDRAPLTETSVARDTEFVFEQGREIHELTSPDGSVYVMQSYSVEIDPSQTTETLSSLGDRLSMPVGWAFTSRVLKEELVVEDIDGIATVIQDEFRNTYQLRSRG